MRSRAIAALGGLWLAAAFLAWREESETAAGGVVVESVRPGWPADKAGIRRGDVLTSWRRAANPPANPSEARGDLRTPFDLRQVEVEQLPRGPVRLLAERGNEALAFELPRQGWGITARPRFSGTALATYQKGERSIQAGRIDAGLGSWRKAATELEESGRRADAAWLHLRVAESDRRAARASYDAAVRQAQAANDWWLLASVYDGYATLLLGRNEFDPAAAAARKALETAELHAPDSLAAADALERLGIIEEERNNPARARELYVRALAIRQRAAPGSIAVAASLGALGRVAAERDSAEDLCGRSLTLWENLAPESLGTARVLNDLGELYFYRADLLVARSYFERAAAIRRKLDPGGLDFASSLHWLGNVAWRRGDLAAAEDFHRRALAIRQRLAPESPAVETSLNSLGNVAGTRKDLDSAERYHRQALLIGEKVSPDRVEAILHNLGEDARLRGDYAGADAFLARALAVNEKLPPGSSRSIAIANTLVSQAAVARDRGDLDSAESLIRRALAIRETLEPDTLHLAEDREVLADVLRARGRLAEARDLYSQILDVASRISPGSELEARSLHGLGLIDRKEGRAAPAAIAFRRAIDALESQKGKLGGPSAARELFSAAYAGYYRDAIQALVDVRDPNGAFWTLERSHARLLLGMLAERDLVLDADLPQALERERLRADAAYERAQNQILQAPARERTDEALGRLASLRAAREEVIEKIKRSSPRYGSLRYPRPLDLDGTRSGLEPGTLLLSYSVGRESSHLFAVEPSGAAGPGLTLYTLAADERTLRESVAAYRNLVDFRGPSGAEARRNLLTRSRSLYDLLIRPAEPLISRYARILIIPDGPLHTLPFAALVRNAGSGTPQYLVDWKPIHIAVSATVYVELKKGRADSPRDPSVVLAAFGDPRYPKFAAAKGEVRRGDVVEAPLDSGPTPDSIADPQLRSVLRGGIRFERLPASRREVEEIAGLYAPKSATYLGANATEERAKSIGRDVPLIHFACHAIINERFPLDSALVFSIPEHPEEGQDNGLLQAWEIFEKVHIDADLVTLSACDSGLGKEMGGEGLIGLTRAFQYAGARSVLASLWKVEDTSTAELMKRFYQYLKAGKTKDEALRSAQIDLIRSSTYSQPRDWAAFQLNGDWK